MRDGLSLLDQAIARGSEEGEISGAMVADMLGLADRGQVFDLMDAVGGRVMPPPPCASPIWRMSGGPILA